MDEDIMSRTDTTPAAHINSKKFFMYSTTSSVSNIKFMGHEVNAGSNSFLLKCASPDDSTAMLGIEWSLS
eukprot:2020562-Amphidinium_carterae.1